MRRPALAILAVLLLAAPAHAQSLTVPVDRAVRIGLSASAKDVAVGNPAIADVTVMDERNILILGKAYGTTNVVVLDRSGRLILDRVVNVTAPDTGRISVYKGATPSHYACSPRCELTTSTGATPPP
ncbi:MAG: pilus assembly protein N-terminal domain-containing protein [Caulobacter sp.]|nr:pilus assembly protein N-terminal domain-containing protein [Caulobacter sp.]